MLIHLSVRDLLLIDEAELDFRPGLNVLTGETGAGKSILLDALGFVLGWRGRGAQLRPGAERGEAAAVFALSRGHPARAVLREAELPEEDELVLRRTLSAEGRRGAFANGSRIAAETLRALADTLVELHGQHDDRGLLNPRGHRALLDAAGGLAEGVEAVRSAWGAARRAAQALAAEEARLAALRGEEAFLRHAALELARLAPEPGEDAALDARRRLMQAAARVGEDVARAQAALGPEGAAGLAGDALRWLDGAAARADGALEAAVAAAGRALTELGEAEEAVSRALEAMAFDPAELDLVEERLFALRGLARKHGVLPDELAALAGDLAARLAALEAGEGALALLARDARAAEAAYADAAAGLGAARRQAAAALDARMAAELPPLKLDRAAFVTEVAPGEPGPEGRDAVTFTVATVPGAPPGPIDRIASGGELSRFLLALKVCLTAGQDGVTMIFDEIDRGVGGATANAVGRRLAALAAGGQVIVVTHSPQVAALGAHHLRVAKEALGGALRSRVAVLDGDGRVEEVARMLAGDVVTAEARGAARALLG